MRLILTILLIGLFKADAQMVINASSPYRVTNIPLLNQFTGSAAAYSLRKLRTEYTGAAIRVRKDTTGQPEQDIFFANNELDTAAIKSFLNARSGFITTWYDQSPNGRNATQATQANQPRIANLGVIERRNTKPTLFFDGSNDHLIADDVATTITGEDKSWTKISVLSKTNTNTGGVVMGLANTSNITPLIYTALSSGSQYEFFIRADNGTLAQRFTGAYASNTQYLLFNQSNGTSYELFINNASIDNFAYNLPTLTLNSFTIGALRRPTISGYFGGNIQESIIYPSNQSVNRISIQTNINSFYSIY